MFSHLIYYPKSNKGLDYLIIKPGWVSTNMTKKDVSPITTSITEEALSIVTAINSGTKETYGHPKHLGMMFALNIIPDPIYNTAIEYLI